MKTRDLVLIALFAAIIVALGLLPPIAVPLIPVPITAQSLGVMLAGAILGAKRGTLAVALAGLVLSGLSVWRSRPGRVHWVRGWIIGQAPTVLQLEVRNVGAAEAQRASTTTPTPCVKRATAEQARACRRAE